MLFSFTRPPAPLIGPVTVNAMPPVLPKPLSVASVMLPE